jgi:hypothetical protein
VKSLLTKIIFATLVSVYVFTTVGVCIIAHYCGGEVEKVSLFTKTDSCCDGEEQENSDCCKDDSKHVVFASDFTLNKSFSEFKAIITNLYILIPSSFHFILQNDVSSFSFLNTDFHPPNLVQSEIVSISVIRI